MEISLVGFGAGTADANIVCEPGDSNPQISNATVVWRDFRFYGEVSGLGIVRGVLNRDQSSFVLLSATTQDGLFPAEFTNNLFITLTLPDSPGVQYQNAQVFQMHATSTAQAPPDLTVMLTQVKNEDVFELVGGSGVPTTITISGSVQEFLDSGGITLSKVGPISGGLAQFRVSSTLAVDTIVAYFVHITNENPLLIEHLDGVLAVPATGQAEFVVDLKSVPLQKKHVIHVYGIVLSPMTAQGADQLTFVLSSDIPTVSAWGIAVITCLLLTAGTLVFRRSTFPKAV